MTLAASHQIWSEAFTLRRWIIISFATVSVSAGGLVLLENYYAGSPRCEALTVGEVVKKINEEKEKNKKQKTKMKKK